MVLLEKPRRYFHQTSIRDMGARQMCCALCNVLSNVLSTYVFAGMFQPYGDG